MSVWTSETEAPKIADAPPTAASTYNVVWAWSNMGENRATRNTPAVTIGAAWIRADTGVGASIASGSQTWRGSCADLARALKRKSRVRRFSVFTGASGHRRVTASPTRSG